MSEACQDLIGTTRISQLNMFCQALGKLLSALMHGEKKIRESKWVYYSLRSWS